MRADTRSSPENQGVNSVARIFHVLPWGQKVLLVGGREFRRSLRASILRAHGLQVDVARTLDDSRNFWQRYTYDWVFVDVHSQLPGEIVDLCEQLSQKIRRPRIAFFVGPPTYVSAKWPRLEASEDKGKGRAAAAAKAAA